MSILMGRPPGCLVWAAAANVAGLGLPRDVLGDSRCCFKSRGERTRRLRPQTDCEMQ
jgi:hypothetical protein